MVGCNQLITISSDAKVVNVLSVQADCENFLVELRRFLEEGKVDFIPSSKN